MTEAEGGGGGLFQVFVVADEDFFDAADVEGVEVAVGIVVFEDGRVEEAGFLEFGLVDFAADQDQLGLGKKDGVVGIDGGQAGLGNLVFVAAGDAAEIAHLGLERRVHDAEREMVFAIDELFGVA